MISVYVIEAQSDPVKVGIAGNPHARLAQLRTGTPFPLRLAHVEDPGELDAATVEKAAHALLKAARVHGEWFSVSVDEARNAVQETIERLRRPPAPVIPTPTSFPRQVGPITPAQSRAARGLLGWTQADLAKAASVGVVTVRQFEGSNAEPRPATLTVMRQALEAAGVIFIPEDRYGPRGAAPADAGVRALVTTLVNLHGSSVPLDKVEAIAGHCSDEDRGALSLAFGDRVWGRENLLTDERGREIQDRLTRTGKFRE